MVHSKNSVIKFGYTNNLSYYHTIRFGLYSINLLYEDFLIPELLTYGIRMEHVLRKFEMTNRWKEFSLNSIWNVDFVSRVIWTGFLSSRIHECPIFSVWYSYMSDLILLNYSQGEINVTIFESESKMTSILYTLSNKYWSQAYCWECNAFMNFQLHSSEQVMSHNL